jgi:hypothetical protein
MRSLSQCSKVFTWTLILERKIFILDNSIRWSDLNCSPYLRTSESIPPIHCSLTCKTSNLNSLISTLFASLKTRSMIADVSICRRIQSTGCSFDLRNWRTLKNGKHALRRQTPKISIHIWMHLVKNWRLVNIYIYIYIYIQPML